MAKIDLGFFEGCFLCILGIRQPHALGKLLNTKFVGVQVGIMIVLYWCFETSEYKQRTVKVKYC